MPSTAITRCPEPVDTNKAAPAEPMSKAVGGSRGRAFNSVLFNQVIQTLREDPSPEQREKQTRAVIQGLMGIAPRNELEGMLAGQMVACHNAAMECYRRATHPEQTFEGRKENLTQANKLSRTYASLLEALNRHRGKGQQKVTVEHVHVHSGGRWHGRAEEGRGISQS